MTVFESFGKISRLSRPIIITEKIDGTNASVVIEDSLVDEDTSSAICNIGGYNIYAGSRNRWVTPGDDNYGFASWVLKNADDLVKLGPGRHFGEWWGQGIQRNYSQPKKRFSLFNVGRWTELTPPPSCCDIVPVLYRGDEFDTNQVRRTMKELSEGGSVASPGFMKPEGIVIFHAHSGVLFKKTFEKDQEGKGNQ